MSVTTENPVSATPTRLRADIGAWREAYDEARDRGAGENVARFYAEQRVAYIRRDRDGVAIAGARDYQAYR